MARREGMEMSVGEHHPPEECCSVCGRYRAAPGYMDTHTVCCCSVFSSTGTTLITPEFQPSPASKYPGLQHVTFNEAVEFADRVVRRMGIDRQVLGIRDLDFSIHVAAVYHEMTRIEGPSE